jgi:hypothetical protein
MPAFTTSKQMRRCVLLTKYLGEQTKADKVCETWNVRGATKKFPEFLCRSLITNQNLYLPSSPSK